MTSAGAGIQHLICCFLDISNCPTGCECDCFAANHVFSEPIEAVAEKELYLGPCPWFQNEGFTCEIMAGL